MGKNKKSVRCSDCNKEFLENDIAYICEKCEGQFCLGCYCSNHFEKHSKWQAGIVKGGKLVPRNPETIIVLGKKSPDKP